MKLEFLSEDFDHRKHPDLNGLYLADACALVANQKLERYLKEHGIKVNFKQMESGQTAIVANTEQKDYTTHQAILINIEKLPEKKCEGHVIICPYTDKDGEIRAKCTRCNKIMIATEWKENEV